MTAKKRVVDKYPDAYARYFQEQSQLGRAEPISGSHWAVFRRPGVGEGRLSVGDTEDLAWANAAILILKGASLVGQATDQNVLENRTLERFLVPVEWTGPTPESGLTLTTESDWKQVLGWLGENLASGFVGGIGAMIGAAIWAQATGQVTIEEVIEGAVAEIGVLINAAFAEHERNSALDDVVSANGAVLAYVTAPSHRLGTLENAEESTRDALATYRSERHMVASYGAFATTAAFFLTLLQERIRHFRDPEEVSVFQNTVDEFIRHVERAEVASREYVRNLFRVHGTNMPPIVLPRRDYPSNIHLRWLYQRRMFYGPGVRLASGSHRDERDLAVAEATRIGMIAFDAHVARELQSYEDRILRPIREESMRWSALKEAARVPDPPSP
jgi:hypothetical protein